MRGWMYAIILVLVGAFGMSAAPVRAATGGTSTVMLKKHHHKHHHHKHHHKKHHKKA